MLVEFHYKVIFVSNMAGCWFDGTGDNMTGSFACLLAAVVPTHHLRHPQLQ